MRRKGWYGAEDSLGRRRVGHTTFVPSPPLWLAAPAAAIRAILQRLDLRLAKSFRLLPPEATYTLTSLDVKLNFFTMFM